MARSTEEFERVLKLITEGRNDCEIARLTSIPRETVRDWRSRLRNGSARRRISREHGPRNHDFSAICPLAYGYLLGMYLGDGYIARHRRGVWRLRIACDSRYPGIIAECSRAMETVMPGQRAHVLPRASRSVEVSMYSKHWPCFFPQHGPGRKHQRVIRLTAWQNDLVTQAPTAFLRGLIHSDGCRVVANDRGVTSIRYHFSNRSEDIKELFCRSLDALAIPWTRPCDRQIAIYRRDAVAQLDQFIGPKT